MECFGAADERSFCKAQQARVQWLAKRPAPYRSLLGRSGPKCPKQMSPRVSPVSKGSTQGVPFFGHSGDTLGGTLPWTPPFSGTLSGTLPGALWSRSAQQTPVRGRVLRKQRLSWWLFRLAVGPIVLEWDCHVPGSDWQCPQCGALKYHALVNFCAFCGMRLKWEVISPGLLFLVFGISLHCLFSWVSFKEVLGAFLFITTVQHINLGQSYFH